MKLKVRLRRTSGVVADVVVNVDGAITVGALADVIQRSDPESTTPPVARPTVRTDDVVSAAVTVDPNLSLGESGLASGQEVQVVAAPSTVAASAASLSVLAGPDAGKSFDLSIGLNTIGRGRDSTVRLTDAQVSKRHAKLLVGSGIEIVDDNSSNGILVGGDQVQRLELRDGDAVTLGETVISVRLTRAAAGAGNGGALLFNRSPRVDPLHEGLDLDAPEPPTPASPQRFPLITSLVPLLMGGILFAITKSAFSVLFVALSPLMLIGGYWENKRSARRALAEAVELFHQNLAELVVDLRQAHDAERAGRAREHPSTAEVVEAVGTLAPLVWTRRPEHDRFLSVRLGLGRQPSRTKVEVTRSRNSPVDLQRELTATIAPYRTIDNVPIVADLPRCGSLGVSGPELLRAGVARGLVAQLVGLHSPSEVTVVAFASPRTAVNWDWLKWLPHVGGDHSPLASPPLATTAPACNALVSELDELVELRRSANTLPGRDPWIPAVVVIVEDDAPARRSALVQLAERGGDVGVHLMWMAESTALVPAAARTFLELDPVEGASTGKVLDGEHVEPVVVEPLDVAGAEWVARRLSPVVDAGAAAEIETDVPSMVSFLAEAGPELGSSTSAVVERWTESNSLHPGGGATHRLKRDNTLRALVGRSALDPLHLDLRTQGPHALVGGTTGAGKSEFLQTWILGMAVAHSPQRVTFLFVDYKGGSAFADCVNLPHSVGLVTDLSPHLVQRALVSLNAELRYREHVLNRKKAKDLLELERRGDPEAPPSLVIVVDEFAALVQEVPEFVDGVVNVAQRGRSLGLHLILATQRPAGVIKDNLRANTNLRVALRMADEEDSKDVIGTTQAAAFDPGLPGRGVAKTGPGRLTLFQSGYVGGYTTDEPPPAQASIATLAFGSSVEWPVPEAVVGDSAPAPERTDIQRIVDTVGQAALEAGVEPPRRPWLPELASVYDLAELPTRRRDEELVFGVVDQPALQEQGVTAFRPNLDGNMAVFGAGGSGKSSFLRTLAVASGLTARSGPCFVYGLDFGSRGLTMLERLPHVGSIIGSDDNERIVRLINHLREVVDERAVRYAKVNAATLDEYRVRADRPDEPRNLLLIDGFGAFRNAYEVGPSMRVFEMLQSVAADGRPVGVHVVLSADRLGAVPSSVTSSVQRTLALRLANEMDEAMLSVPKSGFGDAPPPGRGFLDGTEVQVAVFGGTSDVAAQAGAIDRLAVSMERAGAIAAPPIERLPEEVRLSALPVAVGGRPALGLADDTLGPIGFEPNGTLLVAGPGGSGRSTTVRTIVESIRRVHPEAEVVYLGQRRSALASLPWSASACGPADVTVLAEQLAAAWKDDESGSRRVVVLDGIGEFLNSEADYALQELLKVCRSTGAFVVADGETSEVQGSWPLIAAVRGQRHGIVLQPDQGDGDTLFRTTFPRMSRADFPVGRGMYVRNGRATRVQVAAPM